MRILLITAYDCPDLDRAVEYATALRRNAHFFHRIQILAEDGHKAWSRFGLLPPNAVVEFVDKRQTFSDLLMFANERFDCHHVVLSNSDIVFDETIKLVECIDWRKSLCVLAKHETCPGRSIPKLVKATGSFDAFAFVPKVSKQLIAQTRFYQGRMHCDKRFAFEAQAAGYHVFNPCRHIHATHLHKTKYRTYNASSGLWGPTATVNPDVTIP
jgi:hypothetical protein